ncbi:MAG: tRNA (cytidine(34)-2'-O)-methyltransferase [Alphaproteobacteria bacterium]|nr:tRNA (cytidine(34)-2'-O)-methyltransferase [Alphaproteobacteria bacterium]
MHLVLFQPEIPQNMGALMRFSACMNLPLDVIEPCGFLFSDKHLKRAGMDYMERAMTARFSSWKTFCQERKGLRRVAVSANASQNCYKFSFKPSDLLIMGKESSGFPSEIIEDCHETIVIPMIAGVRSLNLALAAAIVSTEALRQTHQLPGDSL